MLISTLRAPCPAKKCSGGPSKACPGAAVWRKTFLIEEETRYRLIKTARMVMPEEGDDDCQERNMGVCGLFSSSLRRILLYAFTLFIDSKSFPS